MNSFTRGFGEGLQAANEVIVGERPALSAFEIGKAIRAAAIDHAAGIINPENLFHKAKPRAIPLGETEISALFPLSVIPEGGYDPLSFQARAPFLFSSAKNQAGSADEFVATADILEFPTGGKKK